MLSGEDCARFNKINIPKINSDIIKEQAKNNISQYDNFSVFASKTVVIQLIDDEMKFYNALMIFPLEIIMMQEAAINRANLKIIKALKDNNFQVDTVNDISLEFLKTLIFWDINFFKYKTMQNITDNIIKAFEIDKTKQMFKENQELLENLINIYATISEEKESKILNSIAILFAFVGATPLAYTIIKSISSSNYVNVKNIMLSTITLFFTAFPIIMIVMYHNRKRLLKNKRSK